MEGEESGQVKVGVGIESLWGTLVNGLSSTLPTIIPQLITEGQTLRGNGGLGTVYLFKFGAGVPKLSYQKEEVVELDERVHRIGLQVIEGGRLDLGFTFYKNSIQLSAIGESETQVDLTVNYVTQCRETEVPPGESVKAIVAFVKALEAFLLQPNQ